MLDFGRRHLEECSLEDQNTNVRLVLVGVEDKNWQIPYAIWKAIWVLNVSKEYIYDNLKR